MDGLKWISSFPENVAAGIPRASAVLILNDHDTGYPFAVLESSIISATRTAASAALAADWLSRGRGRPTRVGFIGTGLIARYIHTFLAGHRLVVRRDRRARPVRRQRGRVPRLPGAGGLRAAGSPCTTSAEELIRASDLVVFATVAGAAARARPGWFAHNPLVLHVSLRDLAPEILLASTNIVDDVEHCLKADTSPHLAEQLTGNRDFLDGTLDDVMAGRVTRAGRPAGGVLPVRPRACSTSPSASTSTTRWRARASCTSSTGSSTTSTGTADSATIVGWRATCWATSWKPAAATR